MEKFWIEEKDEVIDHKVELNDTKQVLHTKTYAETYEVKHSRFEPNSKSTNDSYLDDRPVSKPVSKITPIEPKSRIRKQSFEPIPEQKV